MPLKFTQIINCRFVDELSSYLEHFGAKNHKVENCEEHNISLLYYCINCSEPLCSDCFMFGQKHKDHQIMHLDNIYKTHVDNIKSEAKDLQNKFDQYTQFLKQVEEKIDLVRLAKQDRSNELEDLFENMKNK